ncbi:hypothetical protein [Sphingomonas melonis]|uniref:ATP dependent DNA ligase n=1 Tax=Sphingomonas melonis TaxID=152682 RepID=UPI001F36A599|nr:hypothetical protein [Sphingomonas melonis]
MQVTAAGVREGDGKTGGWRYTGKVGTGFDTATMDDLIERLATLKTDAPPVDATALKPFRAAIRGARWVRPDLVAEIAFAETTPDGLLRHASFLGLRGDKPADTVVAEVPEPAPDQADTPAITSRSAIATA